MSKYFEELQGLLEGEVHGDPETMARFSADASVFQMTPSIVVAPKNVSDISKLVRFVAEKRHSDNLVSLTASAARTDMSGGPLTSSIVVDFLPHFRGVMRVDASGDGGFATALPGTYYRDFEAETIKQGLILPSYPASREMCTIGGMVANNSGGELTLKYGKTEDYIRELKAVFSDGNEYSVRPLTREELLEKTSRDGFEAKVYREVLKLIEDHKEEIMAAKPNVSKNSAGYPLWSVWNGETFDLTKLLCGSQGTLALVTEVTVRLVRRKSYDRLAAIFLNDISVLGELTRILLQYGPENLESYDDNTLKLALRYLPDIVRILKPRFVLKLALQFLPEMWMVVKHGRMPRLVILAQFAGDDPSEVDARMKKAIEALSQFECEVRVTRSDDEEKKYWTIRRESFNLLRKHLSGRHTASFIDDFVVRPEFLPEFLPKLNNVLRQYELTYTIAGHVGDGNFHIIPLMDFKDPRTGEVIGSLSSKVYELVLAFKGSISGEHNDGLIRTPFLRQMYGDAMIGYFEQVKKIFDPQAIFNPGKKVNGDLIGALRHLKRD